MCQANLFAGRMEIEVRFDRVSVMAIQKKKVAGRSKSRKTNSAWRYHKKSMMLISMILVLLVGAAETHSTRSRKQNWKHRLKKRKSVQRKWKHTKRM